MAARQALEDQLRKAENELADLQRLRKAELWRLVDVSRSCFVKERWAEDTVFANELKVQDWQAEHNALLRLAEWKQWVAEQRQKEAEQHQRIAEDRCRKAEEEVWRANHPYVPRDDLLPAGSTAAARVSQAEQRQRVAEERCRKVEEEVAGLRLRLNRSCVTRDNLLPAGTPTPAIEEKGKRHDENQHKKAKKKRRAAERRAGKEADDAVLDEAEAEHFRAFLEENVGCS